MKSPVQLKQAILVGKFAQHDLATTTATFQMKAAIRKGKKSQVALDSFNGEIDEYEYSALLNLSISEAILDMSRNNMCLHASSPDDSHIISVWKGLHGSILVTGDKLTLDSNIKVIYTNMFKFAVPNSERLAMIRHGIGAAMLRNDPTYSKAFHVHRYGANLDSPAKRSPLYKLGVSLVGESLWVGILDDSEVVAMRDTEDGVVIDLYKSRAEVAMDGFTK